MNDQWEAFTERVAIMEFEGKLSHDAAVMEAFKIHYPADYTEMVKNCKEIGHDPEKEIVGFIDALEGPSLSAKQEAVATHGNASELPPIAQETRLEGIDILYHFAEHNCGIRDFWEKGMETSENFTTDKEKIFAMWDAGKKQFKVFLRGFMVIDIDQKNAGLDRFYEIYDKKRLPSTLQNMSAFPCHAETPNGGFHLYFKYAGTQLQAKYDIDPAIK